jgi:asparagine synthase (glutamine-hydrolysing)
MCGIIGCFSSINSNELVNCTNIGLKKIRHRGPDAERIHIDAICEKNIVFGHVRLSIIDLSDRSNQPMLSADKNYIIVFNGEIYNYMSIRNELISLGYKFQTTGDTEVVLNGYICWGEKILDKLDGIFAFAVLNKNDNKIFIARDNLGVKPLYYYYKEGNFAFASEIKGLLAYRFVETDFDKNMVPEYFMNMWLYEPDTGFINIKKIPPGSFMEVSLDNIRVERYWDIANLYKGKKNSVNTIEALIGKVVNEQLVSDVPLGLLYSGGVDSSLIAVNIKRPITGFIAKYPENETKNMGFVNDYYYANKIIPYTTIQKYVLRHHTRYSLRHSPSEIRAFRYRRCSYYKKCGVVPFFRQNQPFQSSDH